MKQPLEHYVNGGYITETVKEETAGKATVVVRLVTMPECLGQGHDVESARKELESVREAFITARYNRGAEIPEPDFDISMVASVSTTRTSGGATVAWDEDRFHAVVGGAPVPSREFRQTA